MRWQLLHHADMTTLITLLHVKWLRGQSFGLLRAMHPHCEALHASKNDVVYVGNSECKVASIYIIIQMLATNIAPPAPKNLVMDPCPSVRGPSSKSDADTASLVQGIASPHFWNIFMTTSAMTWAVGPALRKRGIGQDLLRSPLPKPPPPPLQMQSISASMHCSLLRLLLDVLNHVEQSYRKQDWAVLHCQSHHHFRSIEKASARIYCKVCQYIQRHPSRHVKSAPLHC